MDDAASRRTSSAASIGQHGAHSGCSLQHLCYMISPLFAASRTALGRSFLPTSTLCWTFRVFRSGQKQGGIRGRTRGRFHEAGRGFGALLDITSRWFFSRALPHTLAESVASLRSKRSTSFFWFLGGGVHRGAERFVKWILHHEKPLMKCNNEMFLSSSCLSLPSARTKTGCRSAARYATPSAERPTRLRDAPWVSSCRSTFWTSPR